MCGRKSKSSWLLLAALLFLSPVFSWAEELTESQLYLLAGEVSTSMKQAGLEDERNKLYRIFGYFTTRFETLEAGSLEWQNQSKRQEAIAADLQTRLQKASDEAERLQLRLPMLEKKAQESETSLANLIEEKRWDGVRGFGIGVAITSFAYLMAHLFWK